ncbi:MAG: hypothetical protein HYZ72_18565 [Deltaproteobacteria bacterium]|nr:hypothetical protein [Deltaproteobacteria bacterium]
MVAALGSASWALWGLGYPEQALSRSHEALRLAQELGHPYSQAHALTYTAGLHQRRREVPAVQERAEALIEFSREQGFLPVLTAGIIIRGCVLVEQGQGEEGIAQIRQGMAACLATGLESGRSSFLGVLAEAYGKVGQAEEGLTALAEALAAVDRTGERFYEAELYRLKGELTLQQSSVQGLAFSVKSTQKVKGKGQKAKVETNPQPLTPSPQAEAEAEACFHKAIEIARWQQAKSWERRAVMSLARSWQQQGKTKEAWQMLAEIYNWFTEGFDTADLQEAKTLLEELEGKGFD